MEYITAEQFLEQSKEIQELLQEWWTPLENDLYVDVADTQVTECLYDLKYGLYYSHKNNMSYRDEMIPLLTEGQLRQFIEDKTNTKIYIAYYTYKTINFQLFNKLNIKKYFNLKTDSLLEAYWLVALEIAKESVING